MNDDNNAEVTPTGELTPGEHEAVKRSALGAAVDNIVAAERKRWDEEALEDVRQYRQPAEKPKVAQLLDSEGREVHRLMSPTEPLYARMSETERQWRSPDSDHWGAEWFRGQAFKDPARMARAYAGLESVYGRAVMTEGAAGAAGAVAAGTAGELMPRPLENIVLIARDRVAKMRRFASSIVMTRQQHNVPTSAAMTAYMTAEEVTATDGSPAIAQVPLVAHKGQVTALFTVELFEDSAINIMNFLATRGGGALGVLEDNQFFKDGDGSAPNITAFIAGTAHTEDTVNEFNFADAVDMYHSVPQVYRDNAVWFIASNVMQWISGLLNASGDKQFYAGLTDAPTPITDDPTAIGTILRRPVYEVPLTAGTVWFGDPRSAYVIGTRQGLTSKMSEHVKFDVDQIMWKLTQRFDGNNLDASAAQNCTGITTVGIT